MADRVLILKHGDGNKPVPKTIQRKVGKDRETLTVFDRYVIPDPPTSSPEATLTRKARKFPSGEKFSIKFYGDKNFYEREIKMLKSVETSESIVHFKEHSNSLPALPKTPVAVLEYCIADLSTFLEQAANAGQTPSRQLRRIFASILDGVADCHEQGIVHCNLSPQNILYYLPNSLTSSTLKNVHTHSDLAERPMSPPPDTTTAIRYGIWKIGNFEYAHRYREEIDARSAPPPLLCAPEIVQNLKNGNTAFTTFSIDLWGIGLILYFLCNGSLPFDDAKSVEEVLEYLGHPTFQVPITKTHAPDRQTLRVLSRLLEKNTQRRMTLNALLNTPHLFSDHEKKMQARVQGRPSRSRPSSTESL